MSKADVNETQSGKSSESTPPRDANTICRSESTPAMSEERVQRRLAAILAIDVVGYSRLTERDEVGTLATLKSRRQEILQPMISKHNGRIIKLIGDGALIEFGSAVNAVDCAVELQKAMDIANADVAGDRRIVLRAGINLGDVMVEGNDLYGDGVNVAARLESLSEPGGLCISGSVFEQINGKLPHSFVSLGSQTLKNIDRPVQTYRLAGKDGAAAVVSAVELSLPAKPSIVVLPFVNMSADAEQAYFVDGLTEDLITDLSKVPELFVIARNSSFAYKGRSVDTRQIARELGVKYVLEGSARRVADRVRINAQLIDAPAGGHIWADRFDRDLADIFAAQDESSERLWRGSPAS
ncbi:adenylate/guanylate cyclase domain-containing protein [Mesorhizobium sp.]|uniref:adenylate/guanylate cyclase domain-containing protein n=1 Tax=Mesorhizobium sp. TaxID=1871066 RepID=UPI0025E39064|nr:adenylate/guanylate cyclase domain-containing protein [Mesorhizobium sp.]